MFARFQQVLAVAISLGVLGGGAAADAATITFDSIGDTATIHYGATVDGANLCADVSYSLTSWSGTSAAFHVSATNCSSGAGSAVNPNRLVAFAVAVVDPNLTGASVPGVSEWDATINTSLTGFGTVELCNYAGSTCSGGASLGVFVGDTDEFDLILSFTSMVSSVSPISFVSAFSSMWEAVGTSAGFVQFAGCLQGAAGCATSPVPESGTLPLLGVSMVAFGVARRRKAVPIWSGRHDAG